MIREFENDNWRFDGFDNENPNLVYFERLEKNADGTTKYTEDYRSHEIVKGYAPVQRLTPTQLEEFFSEPEAVY